MSPQDLEALMVAKQAARNLMNQWDAVAEYVKFLAKARREYYTACLSEGFAPQEALYLAGLFQFPGATGGNV